MDFESLQTIKKSSLLLLHIISIMFFGSWPNKNLITQRISAALGKKNRVKVAVFIGCGLNGSWYSLSFNCCVLKEVCWLIIWKVSFHTTHSLLLCNIVSRLEPFLYRILLMQTTKTGIWTRTTERISNKTVAMREKKCQKEQIACRRRSGKMYTLRLCLRH